MARADLSHAPLADLPEAVTARWAGRVTVDLDAPRARATLRCPVGDLVALADWLFGSAGYAFGTLVVEERAEEWQLRYVFYGSDGRGQAHVTVRQPVSQAEVPSISPRVIAADWHEREVADLFGLAFEGHPRLGGFVLHESWPPDAHPMRAREEPPRPLSADEAEPEWRPVRVVDAAGAFAMPIGPIYAGHGEAARFLLETVGEDVIRTIPRFFYKYRGVERLAEGRSVADAVLLAERFCGTSAFAHSLALCHAAEEIGGVEVPPRARALRVLLAELERVRHHVAAIGRLCSSTALAVSASQAGIVEEELLRHSCVLTGHRYLFGCNVCGGLAMDPGDEACQDLVRGIEPCLTRLRDLLRMLRVTSSFLDRLEGVGTISTDRAVAYGLVGPIARASAVERDLRRALPYGGYRDGPDFTVPCEQEGDGFARLRILFAEVEQSAQILAQTAGALPDGPVCADPAPAKAGAALGWVEAPSGAAFHWLRTDEQGRVSRYRITSPAFINLHGFHLAAEEFAFQDFPILLAGFGLTVAECDR